MSIKYSFTEHGSIRIECGDEWIEVGLREDAAPNPAPPPKAPDAPIPPIPPRKPVRLRRPTYPGTSFVVISGTKHGDEEDLFQYEADPESFVDISRLVGREHKAIEDVIAKYMKRVGKSRIIDVNADDLTEDEALNLDALKSLIDDPHISLDAFRLWKK